MTSSLLVPCCPVTHSRTAFGGTQYLKREIDLSTRYKHWQVLLHWSTEKEARRHRKTILMLPPNSQPPDCSLGLLRRGERPPPNQRPLRGPALLAQLISVRDINRVHRMFREMICGNHMVHIGSPEREEAYSFCFLPLRLVSRVNYNCF